MYELRACHSKLILNCSSESLWPRTFRFVSFRFFPLLWAVAKCCCHFPRIARYAYAALTLIIRHVKRTEKSSPRHLGNKSHILKLKVDRKADEKHNSKRKTNATTDPKCQMGKRMRRNGKTKDERPKQSKDSVSFSLFSTFCKSESRRWCSACCWVSVSRSFLAGLFAACLCSLAVYVGQVELQHHHVTTRNLHFNGFPGIWHYLSSIVWSGSWKRKRSSRRCQGGARPVEQYVLSVDVGA